MPDPVPIPAYILAGGRSRRFGSDKARATLAGQPLITRLAHQLTTLGYPVTAVADRPDKYADLDLPTLADTHPGQGPLAGLHTALTHARQGWALICSCDLLELPPAHVHQLQHHRRRAPSQNPIAAVAFYTDRWQPFPGLYHTRLLPEITTRLAAGRRSLQALLHAAATHPVPADPALPPITQANTPAQLDAYRQSDREA